MRMAGQEEILPAILDMYTLAGVKVIISEANVNKYGL
jgi:hypothetical protein